MVVGTLHHTRWAVFHLLSFRLLETAQAYLLACLEDYYEDTAGATIAHRVPWGIGSAFLLGDDQA